MRDDTEQNPRTVVDACAVLTLYATAHFQEVLADNFDLVLIPSIVCEEAKYLRTFEKESVELVSVDYESIWSPLITQFPATDDEEILETWIDLATDLDDGEAMSAAIAIHHGYSLVTDDKKAIRLLGDRLEIRTSLDLIEVWSRRRNIDPRHLAAIFEWIEARGYVPPRAHRLRGFWNSTRELRP